MIEKVNPSHPDKVADRIAGAIVDLEYTLEENPKVAVEVLIGHGVCHVIIETSTPPSPIDIENIIKRIGGANMLIDLAIVPQDKELAKNQEKEIRCGDNGIFKGVPLTELQKEISKRVRELYKKYPYDGKFILTNDKLFFGTRIS